MVGSTLNPDNFPAVPDRVLGRGHGTGALGPSDTSDSGSDITGAPDGADIDVDHIETVVPPGLDIEDVDVDDVEQALARGATRQAPGHQ